MKTPKRKVTSVKTRVLKVPPALIKLIKANNKTYATFEAFPYCKKKDYVEWITKAKTPETRDKRTKNTSEWLAEGKWRNWNHENCQFDAPMTTSILASPKTI